MSNDVTEFIENNLIEFTGLKKEKVRLMLDRKTFPTHVSEWQFWNPKDKDEISFFYYCSRAYLFGNSIHKIPQQVYDLIPSGKTVLDYGGGVGSSSFALAFKGCKVIFYDMSLIQTEFVKYCTKKHGLNITIIDPNPNVLIPEINEKIDVALSLDVLEHLPDYHLHVSKIADITNSGGLYAVYAPFRNSDMDEPSHLRDTLGFEHVMKSNSLIKEQTLEYTTIYRKI